MINKISFTGRETMFTKNITKNVVKSAENKFFKSTSCLGNIPLPKMTEVRPQQVVVNSSYTSPFALIQQPKVVEDVNAGIANNLHFFG